jgi:hypothetical protein
LIPVLIIVVKRMDLHVIVVDMEVWMVTAKAYVGKLRIAPMAERYMVVEVDCVG